jgi:hypothetical protein
MKLGRRQFFEKAKMGVIGLAIARASAVGGAALLMTSCSVEQDILNWVPIGTNAITTIITLLVNAGILACITCSVVATAAVAAMNAIADAIRQYMAAPAADKTTVLAKVILVMQDAVKAAMAFFQSVTIPGGNTLATTIAGLVSMILDALTGWIQQLHPTTPTPAPAVIPKSVKFGEKTLDIHPTPMKAAAFKSKWNAALAQAGHQELSMK